ncbi:MAG: MBL fold metallo-hydrolase [Phycisphaerales bacterium JB038]
MRIRVISIGALAANHLWNEPAPVRTGHATTTLIEAGEACILVDPGLPPQVLTARLSERANRTPEQITQVFLTSFNPDTCRGIEAFGKADWLIGEAERETIGVNLVEQVKRAHAGEDEELRDALGHDVAVLQRCQAAPDTLAPGVDLFPLHGATPGLTGLIISEPNTTTLICGDAIPTTEHLEQGSVLRSCFDVAKAQESFREAVEIADVLILGRDNLTINPTRFSMF